MNGKREQKVWWIWILLGLAINLLTGSEGLLNKTGLVIIALGVYDLLSQKINKWLALLLVIFGLLFYDLFIGLLAGIY